MKKNQKGQTSVEYILLVAMMIFVGSTVFKKIESYMLTNPNSLLNRYLIGFEKVFTGSNNGVNATYKTFRLPR